MMVQTKVTYYYEREHRCPDCGDVHKRWVRGETVDGPTIDPAYVFATSTRVVR